VTREAWPGGLGLEGRVWGDIQDDRRNTCFKKILALHFLRGKISKFRKMIVSSL
jgi:hypothetical protein